MPHDGPTAEPVVFYVVGKVQRYDGVIYVVTTEQDVGCVLYGPYSVLDPGSYEVEFNVMPQDLGNTTCCVLDVLRRGRTIVAEKDFTATELIHRNGTVLVRFEVIERDTFEFRVSATGGAALTARYQRPVRLLSPALEEPRDETGR